MWNSFAFNLKIPPKLTQMKRHAKQKKHFLYILNQEVASVQNVNDVTCHNSCVATNGKLSSCALKDLKITCGSYNAVDKQKRSCFCDLDTNFCPEFCQVRN